MSIEEAIKILAFDEEYFLTEEEHEAYIMAIEALKEKNERKQEWIPCSERLPDFFEVVLVTDECGNVFEYERRPLDYDGNVCREWSFLSRNIIAWMPLPEPYKKEEARA